MSTWKEGHREAISRVVHDSLDCNAHLVRSWVLLVDYVDDDGEDAWGTTMNEGQHVGQHLGLLTHAIEIERGDIFARQWRTA